MTPNNKLLFDILRVSLGYSDQLSTSLTAVDWSELYKLSAKQGVLALVWDGISSLPMDMQPPRNIRIKWAINVELIEHRYRQQLSTIEKLAQIYSNHNFKMMLLKGYGLSLCYPKPEHRPCGDIDIWLYGDQQQADDTLRQQDFVIDEDEHHHTVFSINGIMVENHYDFLNIYAHKSNREIEKWLKMQAYQSTDSIQINDQTIYLPNADFNALFLLRHAAAHFAAEEIGLRHIIDWVVFVDKYHSQIDWETICTIASQQNMHKFLHCINAISVDYFGLDESKLPVIQRNKSLEIRVLKDIITPEFDEKSPKGSIIKILRFKYRRWWANRWKHHIVYKEGLFQTFWMQIWSHLLKPKSLTR